MKKRELIEKKLDEFYSFAIAQKFPLHDRVEEFKKKYSTEQIVGIVQRFLIPAKESDCLQEYMFAELERYKLMCLASGLVNPSVLGYEFSDQHKQTIVKMVENLIRIIQL